MDGGGDLIPGGIGDEQVAESAPLVRSLVVQRLERMWRALDPYLEADEAMGTKPDPRYLETGVRVLRELVRLYRLDAVRPVPPAEPDVVADVEAVERELLELEAKLRPDEPSA